MKSVNKTALMQIIQTLKNEWYIEIHNAAHQKFIVMLFVIVLALTAIQIDISKQIDTQALIRIHVLGNSNSEIDQSLKLKVKDVVVAHLAPQLKDSKSLTESRTIIHENMNQITAIANETLKKNNSTDTVTLQYGHFDFPIKYYGSFSLPAGNYEALRILIGDAKGRNWWCVLFPPLCFTDSSIQDNMTESGKYTANTPDEKIMIKWRGKELIEKWIAGK